ncbi:MAG: RnfABCDGE type electron transport complex subunit G [Terrisporobacter othiniensis]|uniref:RnfABCDGE type electron transport complex subunit G n=1 Tax=Terrisporobacter petrolearius TaxID=1460447 RepID=UPI0022E96060|nr:RnfABCDGE type electron transport complex subunit G [Terrisporobacter petrolearius]MDU4860077.1 RnfABCDGE type electron transport complex subunit G [Terrisporobacter othiniensis]MDU6994333.1 RnfABCDGE type electron transport complex subunit G [Terrisporobacter othiniensis]
MNSILKLGLNLFIICAIAAGLLAGTNQMTAPVIEQRNEQANDEARKIVLSEAKEFKLVDSNKYKNKSDVKVVEVYEGLNGSDVAGYTIKVLPKGYGGEIELMVGVSKDGTISGVKVGNMTETPGLGAKAKEEPFYSQYAGKPATELNVVKSGAAGETEIQAISGATITSKAVTKGVNTAVEIYESINK